MEFGLLQTDNVRVRDGDRVANSITLFLLAEADLTFQERTE